MRVSLGARFRKPLAQLEDAHEVTAGLRDEQLADRLCFSAQRLRAARAVTLPQVDDRERRGVMPRISTFANVRADPRRDEPAQRRAIQQREIPRGATRRRAPRDELLRRRAQSFARNDAVDEPRLERFVRRQRPARQHQIEGERGAEELDGAHRAAVTGVDPELHLGQPQRALVGVDDNAIVARERQLQSAPERKAVDRRHSGHGECRNSAEQRLTARRHLGRVRGIAQARELLDVGAEDEAAALAGLEHDAA